MSSQPMFALVDCNNFFVSCERVFRPDLEGKPVIVLSSNDGCAVARSNEVKALGIPMGAPVFKYRHILDQHKVVQFSANFELYATISRRITSILTNVTPRTEVYSIDESFLDLSQLPVTDYVAWGKQVRQNILNWVGVPVSIGIAPSKTLAKLASERAKKDATSGGVILITPEMQTYQTHLEKVGVQDVWGIGWRLGPKLKALGIHTAMQVSKMSPTHAQQLMGIHGRQLVAELRGMSCIPLEVQGKAPKSIAATRTFGEDTGSFAALEAAVATFTVQTAYKLRRSHQATRKASLFVTTNRFKPGYQKWSREVIFQTPTNDTQQILQALHAELLSLYNPGALYHRAGVLLYDFIPDSVLQIDLLGAVHVGNHEKATARMQAVDTINERFGRRHITVAAELLAQTWQPRRNLRSPRYTSSWDDLPECHIF